MFRRLQVKLTVLYAALFGAVLLTLSAAIYVAAAGNAQRIVEGGLASAGQVFDRLWAVRSERLREGARLLSKDFGFREALGTRDAATIASAVDNLRERLGLDMAFVLGPDGAPIALPHAGDADAARQAGAALDKDPDAAGVFFSGGAPYEMVSAPILAPDPKGWIVFAVKLDGRQMKSLEQLSAIPLRAAVARRGANGWVAATPAPDLAAGAGLDRLVARSLRRDGTVTAPGAHGDAMALARPLHGMDARQPFALVLSYPLDAALAPYRLLLWLMLIVGATGMGMVVVGSWALARSVTRPLLALTRASRALQEGEAVSVAATSRDEVGTLAQGFNAMAEAVREREARIRHAARHDEETGLLNREGLAEAAGALATREPAHGLYVFALSIERFAQVRAAIGHGPAAELVRALGERLRTEGEAVCVARLASDTLGVALLARDDAHAVQRARGAADALTGSFRPGDHLLDVRVVTGLSSARRGASGAEPLIKEADLALDAARGAQTDFAAYDPAQSTAAADRLALMPELRRALAADELAVVHQPKRELRSGRICGVETLVRWDHPRRGPISPEVFVGMAEETGDIRALTEWVLARALVDQARMRAAGHDLVFSVNLSGRLVGDPEFCSHILRACEGAPGRICLEITETAVIAHPEAALASIRRFAEAGIAVSIDDYGSGLSSLAYLKRIEADELKLDRSLIMDMVRSSKDALLVRSTIELAHALGLKVTAEGVEDAAAFALLAGMGCDIAQGWFVSRPMSLAKLGDFLAAADAAPAAATVEPGARRA